MVIKCLSSTDARANVVMELTEPNMLYVRASLLEQVIATVEKPAKQGEWVCWREDSAFFVLSFFDTHQNKLHTGGAEELARRQDHRRKAAPPELPAKRPRRGVEGPAVTIYNRRMH